MNEFAKYFLGSHGFWFHIAGLVFCLIGALGAKYHFWRKHKAQEISSGRSIEFNSKYWWKNNWIDILISLLVSFISVRFIDVLLHWLNPKLQAGFGFEIPLTEDQIFYYFLAGVLIQLWIHKMYRKK